MVIRLAASRNDQGASRGMLGWLLAADLRRHGAARAASTWRSVVAVAAALGVKVISIKPSARNYRAGRRASMADAVSCSLGLWPALGIFGIGD